MKEVKEGFFKGMELKIMDKDDFYFLKKVVEFLDEKGVRHNEWGIGGAYSINLFGWYRKTNDIDLFFVNHDLVDLFSPQRNDFIREICDDYHEGRIRIKVYLKPHRKRVDFVRAPVIFVVRPSSAKIVLVDKNDENGKALDSMIAPVYHPIEVLGQKLVNRVNRDESDFSMRDLVDYAVVRSRFKNAEELWEKLFKTVRVTRKKLLKRIPQVMRNYSEGMEKLEIIDPNIRLIVRGEVAKLLRRLQEDEERDVWVDVD